MPDDNNNEGSGSGSPAPAISRRGNDQVIARRLKRVARSTNGVQFNTRVGAPGGGVIQSSGFNFFSPQLSTDFLELPQSDREKHEWFRHYYETDPMVGQALDILTEIPLSKVRLSKPKCEDKETADKVMAYFQKMVDDLRLTRRLHEITHLYWLDGNVFIFAEDDDKEGEDYRGWRKLTILETDQVDVKGYSFSDEVDIEFVPSEEDRRAVRDAQVDPLAMRKVEKMPPEIVEYIQMGENLPLDSDPMQGSFCYHLARRRRPRSKFGSSILERCLRVLLYRDKLRQAQTSIASRNMTPKRVVWGEGLDEMQVDELREMVDLALMDPDFSIVANYQVNWEEYGSNDRLLDLSNEYDITDRQLMVGLGVTLELLTGEGTFTGNRLSLHVMNERFMNYRMMVQEYVEDFLFKPVAIKMGFVEKDAWGYDKPIYPRLSFNRMALADNQDVFSALFDLYQKGSLPVSFILDLFNIDAADVEEKLQRDAFTLNDANFNEAIRNALGDIGGQLAEKSNLLDIVVEHLGLKIKESAGEERF